MVLLIPTTLVQGFILSSALMFVARLFQGIAAAMVFAPVAGAGG